MLGKASVDDAQVDEALVDEALELGVLEALGGVDSSESGGGGRAASFAADRSLTLGNSGRSDERSDKTLSPVTSMLRQKNFECPQWMFRGH